jgi:hypothetical protein
MAQSFDEWLFDLRQEIELLDDSSRQKSIIVVGFVGKDTEERSCSDLINGFLRKKVFSLSRYDFDENPSYVIFC